MPSLCFEHCRPVPACGWIRPARRGPCWRLQRPEADLPADRQLCPRPGAAEARAHLPRQERRWGGLRIAGVRLSAWGTRRPGPLSVTPPAAVSDTTPPRLPSLSGWPPIGLPVPVLRAVKGPRRPCPWPAAGGQRGGPAACRCLPPPLTAGPIRSGWSPPPRPALPRPWPPPLPPDPGPAGTAAPPLPRSVSSCAGWWPPSCWPSARLRAITTSQILALSASPRSPGSSFFRC